MSFGPGGVFRVGSSAVRAAAALPNQGAALVGDGWGFDHTIDWLFTKPDGAGFKVCETSPLLTSFTGLAVLVADGGDILVGGVATTTGSSQLRPIVGRFAAPATEAACDDLATSWAGQGILLLDEMPFCDTEDCRVDDLVGAQTPQGRLFVLVEAVLDATTSRFFVVAINPAGHVDHSFSSDGWAEVPYFTLGFLTSRGSRLAVDPQGRPLVLATRINSARGDKDCVFVRFDASGNLEIAQPITNVPDSDEVASALAVEADGTLFAAVNVLAAVRTGWLYQRSDTGVWSGTGREGRAIMDIALQGDDKVLTVSYSTDADLMMVNRQIRTPTGLAADTSFGTAGGEGSYDVDLGGNDAQVPWALILLGGRPVIVGNASSDSGPMIFGLRLVNSYTFSDGFERGTRASWSSHTF